MNFKMTGDFHTYIGLGICLWEGQHKVNLLHKSSHHQGQGNEKVNRSPGDYWTLACVIVDALCGLPTMRAWSCLVFCDDTKWLSLPFEAPNSHDYFSSVACLTHLILRVKWFFVMWSTTSFFMMASTKCSRLLFSWHLRNSSYLCQ
jgi:hypothetical protein